MAAARLSEEIPDEANYLLGVVEEAMS